ncbi:MULTISPECIES: flagellar hook-associated protein FlgK [Bradyrhizobium]|uniref:flagellar hook-associated protein FlgK n=1 Tax=Bradyrhizobium TaxID=374 RepID=UPI00048A1BC6|nr:MULTISPECIES: flagellar hook-associated protein FlgK [Bradyrhizobium]MCS3451175.1 flagellar hook-associated protein 1 FlgK [Bradyrhizobium elkanii]MCS3566802.1 flagellar hook-associated protein 1 FlgK [Bradyrhizobium elkanii]MCW2152474.1 flagellar hook-associated protein 1 FlgK [Bradyrhizobium elkanii]MCW2357649.1 flagellar hook-associated protein 1 FlgK [Bradyrhizobium elkanii]MCW2376204.1 flagellar hook-associated protein 1 FlgK [Bradyrhizobium elkanii]
MSSLDIARSIAFSGLSATQVQISVASANISNADTKGYTEKTANQSSSVTSGVGTGVTITGISSAVDKLLLKSLVGADSDLGAADTTNSFLTELQQLYGSTSSSDSSTTGTSLANTIAAFESALSSLASTPSSASLQSNAVSALAAVTTQLQQTSSGIQTLRSNADQDIASSVTDINSDLQQISDLNKQIRQQAAAGQSTADLEDQRNSALQDLASMMNVSYFTTSSGDLQVYTGSGQALVDSTAHPLSYTALPSVTASTTYSAGSSSGFSGITVNGVDITSQISSGKVSALITLRDQTLPAAQSQLDELAQQLTATVNAVSNQGTSVPPPASLTGTAPVSSTTPFSATGTVRIAVADKSGNLVSYQDLDLSSYATVGDLATAINGISGLSASVDANGHLSISATTSGNGVAINEMTSSVGSSSEGFSDYFGFNDLITGTGASDIAVRSDILNGTAALPTATLDASSTLTAGNSVLSPGSATVVNALSSALTGSTNFGMAGGLGATTGSFTDYAAAIVANVAGKATQASAAYTAKQTAQATYANSLSSQSGVNIDEESANLSALQNKYAAASQIITAINAMFSALMTAMSAS